MWKKRAETTWEQGVVVKLVSKTPSCIRPNILGGRMTSCDIKKLPFWISGSMLDS